MPLMRENSWLVRWRLLGKPMLLPNHRMLLEVPPEAFDIVEGDVHRRIDTITFHCFDGGVRTRFIRVRPHKLERGVWFHRGSRAMAQPYGTEFEPVAGPFERSGAASHRKARRWLKKRLRNAGLL